MAVEDRGEQAAPRRRDMQDDQHRRRQGTVEGAEQPCQGVDAAGRGTDADDTPEQTPSGVIRLHGMEPTPVRSVARSFARRRLGHRQIGVHAREPEDTLDDVGARDDARSGSRRHVPPYASG